ncbi:MAG: YbhB/YbcL family Raf kinase inhibitor-like protein [Haliscomenobacteraceae bacterium CHB4]|nr:hypothetical protein [Saprospiraceae bacterium]MCE7926543.1 YbhB/YbcL family Raf kinase inhibitor-like protein [Haliscomenobacteraceae bacterium CHB4]
MEPVSLSVTSTAFAEGEYIPAKYTCDGININPPLDVEGIPSETQSLALIVDDPDAPMGTWVHWVVWNIPVSKHIAENHIPGEEGMNDFHQLHYGGPCPPGGTHRYFFKIYALDTTLKLPSGTNKTQLENAMHGHIVGYGALMGLYSRMR